MIAHKALGILSTASWAGVATLLIEAGTIRGTIRVQYTFRTTSLVGITKVLGQALTGAHTILFATLGIGATRIRVARLYNLWRFTLYGRAKHEGISIVARLAIAHGTVAEHTTLRVAAAETWTRILATIVEANQ